MTDGTYPELDLDDLLRERLPPGHLAMYHQLHASHFHHWKVRRVSDPASLRGLRRLLSMAGVVRLQRTRMHSTGQAFHDYAEEPGLPLDDFNPTDQLSGRTREPVRKFSEPGTGYPMYRATKLGWATHGTGDTLRFSIDETLRNCLRDEVRTDGSGQVGAFRSPTVDTLINSYELASVVDSVSQATGRRPAIGALAAIEALAELVDKSGTIDHDSVLRALSEVKELLRHDRSVSQRSGSALFLLTMLGFLVDELVARSTVANGTGFGFRFTDAVLQELIDRLPALRFRVVAVDPDVDGLDRDLRRLSGKCRQAMVEAELPDWRVPGPPDPAWVRQLEGTADRLRGIGFALRRQRKLDEEEADVLFATSNALWRWSFFLEHRARHAELTRLDTSPAHRDEVAKLVLRWLRRPWAVVTRTDVELAFRGIVPGGEQDELPRAFSVLGPMVSGEIEPFLAAALGITEPERARQLVLRLIACRYLLYVCRRKIEVVTFAPATGPDDRSDAALLIELFARWVYAGDDQRIDRLDEQPAEIVSLLRSGAWCDELFGAGLLPRDADVARRYRDGPTAFVSRLFRFDEDGFDVEEHLGFMPPERFTFLARGGRGYAFRPVRY